VDESVTLRVLPLLTWYVDDENLENRLSQLGLSDKEVETYLTILEFGEAKASTVAEAADVSKRYVYSISEELESRGFVTVNEHSVPTTIRAVPPGEVIASLKSDLDRMEPALEDQYSSTEESHDQFEVIKSRVTVLDRIAGRIDGADEEVVIAVPQDRLGQLSEPLSRAVKRGVLVVALVSNVGEEPPDVDGLVSVARSWTEPMPTMVTTDSRSGLVAPTEIITRSTSDQHAIAYSQEQLGPVIVGSFFGNYWPIATELHVAPPHELPGTYHEFRGAVYQSTLHLKNETPLRARIEGRWVGDEGDATTIAGRVVETRQGLVRPVTNSFPVEAAIVVEIDGETYSVGGEGAFIEDFEAEAVTLSTEE